jgi:hypothetical protein
MLCPSIIGCKRLLQSRLLPIDFFSIGLLPVRRYLIEGRFRSPVESLRHIRPPSTTLVSHPGSSGLHVVTRTQCACLVERAE